MSTTSVATPAKRTTTAIYSSTFARSAFERKSSTEKVFLGNLANFSARKALSDDERRTCEGEASRQPVIASVGRGDASRNGKNA